MMSSPDLVAFTKDDGFGEAFAEPWVLPEEFSVPLFTHAGATNPWVRTNSAKFSKDFVLISEFSEQVGPQPLLTVPDDPRVIGTFDLNYFSLLIMSVDYQACFGEHLPGCGYPKISFVEDSKVVLGDSKEGAFAYVHHLTLYDLEARGFVRPFCMAYVSADERKIMQQFREVSSQFTKASELLKAGNRKAFATELEKKLKDLEYTMVVLREEAEGQKRNNGCYSTRASEKANELANVEKSFRDHKELLKQVKSFPRRKKKASGFLTDNLDESTDVADVDLNPTAPEISTDGQTEDGKSNHSPSYTPQLIKAKFSKCFDKRLKTLEELCDVHFFRQTIDQLHLIENIFKGDLCYLYTGQIEQTLLKGQKITNFLFEDDKDCYADEVVQHICSSNEIFGSRFTPSTSILSGQPDTPETALCGETLDVKIAFKPGEEGIAEINSMESSPCETTQENCSVSMYTEMNGDLSSGESVEVNETNSQHLAFQEEEPSMNSESISTMSNSKDFRGGTGPVLAQHAASFPDASCTDVVRVQVSPLFDQEVDVLHGSIFKASPAIRQVPRESPGSCTSFLPDDSSKLLDLTPENRTFSGHPTGDLNPDGSVRPTVGDVVDAMSTSTGCDRELSPFPCGSPITVKHKRRAGHSALRFIRQYPFAQQAIFSLLSGRTLVVLGTDEGTVRKLVNALTIFVPHVGKYGEHVQPWLSCPVQLADLQNWKLIGLHRTASPTGSSMLHSLNRYSRYISILDTDNKMLRCPPYRGFLVTRMADHRTQIKQGATYYIHVQSMLCELASRAFLYTFCHHLHLPISPTEGVHGVALRRADFLHHQWGYGDEDGRVVHFLSELIKAAYLQRPAGQTCPPVFSFSYISGLTYKI